MIRAEAYHCKAVIDKVIEAFPEYPRCKVIQLHPTENRDDMWIVVIGIPLDAPFYFFDDDKEVNVGVIIEPKKDDVKVVEDLEPPRIPPGGAGEPGGMIS